MILTVELYLKVNDETVTLLQEYGKLMRHEIYKVVGVFQKRGQIFNLPYRAISRHLAPSARHLVIKQAKLAQIRMKSRIFPVYGLPRPAALRIITYYSSLILRNPSISNGMSPFQPLIIVKQFYQREM